MRQTKTVTAKRTFRIYMDYEVESRANNERKIGGNRHDKN